jgi:hypothetical protein
VRVRLSIDATRMPSRKALDFQWISPIGCAGFARSAMPERAGFAQLDGETDHGLLTTDHGPLTTVYCHCRRQKPFADGLAEFDFQVLLLGSNSSARRAGTLQPGATPGELAMHRPFSPEGPGPFNGCAAPSGPLGGSTKTSSEMPPARPLRQRLMVYVVSVPGCSRAGASSGCFMSAQTSLRNIAGVLSILTLAFFAPFFLYAFTSH